MIEAIGVATIHAGRELKAFSQFIYEVLNQLFYWLVYFKVRYRETVDQMYVIGVKSVPVMVFSLTFIGLVITLEFSFHMKLVMGEDSLVPSFSTLLLIRELAPVITCLLLTSRVGASIAAEVGTMRVTDQLDAFRLLSIDPVEYLVLPRWFGCVFAAVSISVISVGVAIVGGAWMSTISMGMTMGEYFNTTFILAEFEDFKWCISKAIVFGTIIPLIACFHGFRCQYGAQGVGNASTRAVVHGTLLIIVFDFILTYFLE